MVEDDLAKAVSESNISMVMSIILSQINMDRERDSYWIIDSANYAEPKLAEKGIVLFAPDNGKSVFVEDQGKWSLDMWQILRVELEYNFSRLKLDRIIMLMKYFREQGDPYFQSREKETSSKSSKISSGLTSENNTQDRGSSYRTNHETTKNHLLSAASGSAVLGVVGHLLGYSAIGGAIIGALIGYGIAYTQKRD